MVVQIHLSISRTFTIWKESLTNLQVLHRAQMATHTEMVFVTFTSQALWKHYHLAFHLQNVCCTITVKLLKA